MAYRSDDENDKLTNHRRRAKLALALCWIELGISPCKDVNNLTK